MLKGVTSPRRCFAAVPLSMQTYDRLVRYKDPRQTAASSPTPVPSTESSSTAALLEPLPRSRAGSAVAGAPRPVVEDPQPSSGHRGKRGGSPELSRKRRRFSSRPPEEAGSDAAVGGRKSDRWHRERGYSRERRHRSPERERRRNGEAHRPEGSRGRLESDRHNRSRSTAEHGSSAARDQVPSRQKLEGAYDPSGRELQQQRDKSIRRTDESSKKDGADRPAAPRGEDELADLRSRALAALQARQLSGRS